MQIRDYIVYGLLILIIGGVLAWAAIQMMGKTKGEWNEETRRLARYRAKHWSYKEKVASLKSYLLPSAPDTHFWPALANAQGKSALASKRIEGKVAWRSAIEQPLGEAPRLYFTAEFPMLSNGKEAAMPEVLLTRSAALSTQSEAQTLSLKDGQAEPQWQLRTSEPDAAAELLNANMRDALATITDLIGAHFVGQYATILVAYTTQEEDREALMDQLGTQALQLGKVIPERFWV